MAIPSGSKGNAPASPLPDMGKYIPPEARKWARVFFSGLGIALSILGILGTVATYLIVSSAVSNTQKVVLGQVDGVVATLTDVEGSLSAVDTVKADATNMTGSLASAFRGYSTTTVGISSSLNGIADSLGGVTLAGAAFGGQVQKLKDNAQTLNSASADLSNAATAAESAGNNMGASLDGVQNVRADIGAMIDSLENAKGEIRNTFGLVSLGLLAGMFVLVLLFASVASACVASLL